jgi:hypothetical protein
MSFCIILFLLHPTLSLSVSKDFSIFLVFLANLAKFTDLPNFGVNKPILTWKQKPLEPMQLVHARGQLASFGGVRERRVRSELDDHRGHEPSGRTSCTRTPSRTRILMLTSMSVTCSTTNPWSPVRFLQIVCSRRAVISKQWNIQSILRWS